MAIRKLLVRKSEGSYFNLLICSNIKLNLIKTGVVMDIDEINYWSKTVENKNKKIAYYLKYALENN